MAQKQTTKKPTLSALLRRSTILKKDNARLRESLNTEGDNYQKHFQTQKQTISELRDLVDRRESEIMAMVKTDAWQHQRIETLEAEAALNKKLDVAIDQRITSLEEQLATANSTLEHERETLEQTISSVQCDNALLRQKHAVALEFIRAHCFESKTEGTT